MLIVLLLFLAGVILLFLLRTQDRLQSEDIARFRQSRAWLVSAHPPSTTFNDVAGVDDAKQELVDVVEFLKWPHKFQTIGAHIPHGVLLIGPPGTGKTLLARAVAGEAHVPFYAASGSEFVEMFVGVGASRVRDLFERAKLAAPSIIFIDEIDAFGRQRSAFSGGGTEEREQTLNQVLVEMDGFYRSQAVIVIAATNRPDILDPALVRPGRFDRHVLVDIPDARGRLDILKIRARGKRLDETADLEQVARFTSGLTGADLANLLNEAAILAARRQKSAISMREISDALDRVIGGPQHNHRCIGETEKSRLAYHDVGHALMARLLPAVDPVHRCAIVPRAPSGPCVRPFAHHDRRLRNKTELEDTLAYILAGNEAERLMLGETSTRASYDIERASGLARKMVATYGMSEALGPLAVGTEDASALSESFGYERGYGNVLAHDIDREVRALVCKAAGVAKSLLNEYREELIALAEKLVVEERLEEQAIDHLLDSAAQQVAQCRLDLRVE